MRCCRVRIVASHPLVLLECERALKGLRRNTPYTIGCLEVRLFDEEVAGVQTLLVEAQIASPMARCVLLSSDSSDDSCLRWLSRGVRGVIQYDRIQAELSQAVRCVGAGALWFPKPVSGHVKVNQQLANTADPLSLTARERQVVGCLLQRMSNKEISVILQMTERTVKFHVSNALDKLQLTSRYDLLTRSIDAKHSCSKSTDMMCAL